MAPSIVSISISIGNYLFYCLSRSHHLIQMILLFTSAHRYTVKMSVIIFDNSPFMTTPTWMNVLYNKLLLLGSKYSLNLIKFWINVSFSPQGVEATVFLLVICLFLTGIEQVILLATDRDWRGNQITIPTTCSGTVV